MENRYLYETHLHTSEASACSISSGREHVIAHYNKGYAGIVVTDHFFNGNTAVPSYLPWDERVELFCSGYEAAVKSARDFDFDVFFGLEYNYKGTEFTTYGVDKIFLLKNSDMMSWSLERYIEEVHTYGGFIIHVHPFRKESYIPKIRLYPNLVDAVEVENLHNAKDEYNQKALYYARKHNLPMTKGTDVHFIGDIVGGGMTFHKRPKDIFELIELIKETKY
jgi:histidinol phosphatase-like PHP family hydrolase